MNKKNVVYTCILTHTTEKFSFEKEGNPSICNNMDETGGHYAKVNKVEKKTKQVLTYVEPKMKKGKPTKTEQNGGRCVRRVGGERNEWMLVKGYKLLFIK